MAKRKKADTRGAEVVAGLPGDRKPAGAETVIDTNVDDNAGGNDAAGSPPSVWVLTRRGGPEGDAKVVGAYSGGEAADKALLELRAGGACTR